MVACEAETVILAKPMATNPQTAALNPAALIAASQQRSRFVPSVDRMLIVTFPGETMRCPVKRVIDDDTALILVDSPPMSRMHSFRFETVYGVRRRIKNGVETWEAQYEPDFLAEQNRTHTADQERRGKKAPPVIAPPKVVAKEPVPVKRPAKKVAAKKAPKGKPAKAVTKGKVSK